MKQLDPVLTLLFAGMLIFTGLIIFIEFKFANDGQLFQTVAGLLTGFAGSFFTRLNPKQQCLPDQSDTHKQTVTVTSTEKTSPGGTNG